MKLVTDWRAVYPQPSGAHRGDAEKGVMGSGRFAIPGIDGLVSNILNPADPWKANSIFLNPGMALQRLPERLTCRPISAYGLTINFCACIKFVPSIWTK